MTKKAVYSADAPAPIGPYSQAVRVGDWLLISGQIPVDPVNNEIAPGGIKAQTKQVLQNLQAILNAEGASLQNVVKTTIYLQDLDDFKAMNEVYAAYFTEPYPARATVEVAALPRGVLIEIEAIAYLG